jgi:hypothetical protein
MYTVISAEKIEMLVDRRDTLILCCREAEVLLSAAEGELREADINVKAQIDLDAGGKLSWRRHWKKEESSLKKGVWSLAWSADGAENWIPILSTTREVRIEASKKIDTLIDAILSEYKNLIEKAKHLLEQTKE